MTGPPPKSPLFPTPPLLPFGPAEGGGHPPASLLRAPKKKPAGVHFNVSTAGYSNIVVRCDHRVTSTASKYYRLQYTTDGNTFLDYQTPITMIASSSTASYYEAQTNSLASASGVDNNPNFAF